MASGQLLFCILHFSSPLPVQRDNGIAPYTNITSCTILSISSVVTPGLIARADASRTSRPSYMHTKWTTIVWNLQKLLKSAYSTNMGWIGLAVSSSTQESPNPPTHHTPNQDKHGVAPRQCVIVMFLNVKADWTPCKSTHFGSQMLWHHHAVSTPAWNVSAALQSYVMIL